MMGHNESQTVAHSRPRPSSFSPLSPTLLYPGSALQAIAQQATTATRGKSSHSASFRWPNPKEPDKGGIQGDGDGGGEYAKPKVGE